MPSVSAAVERFNADPGTAQYLPPTADLCSSCGCCSIAADIHVFYPKSEVDHLSCIHMLQSHSLALCSLSWDFVLVQLYLCWRWWGGSVATPAQLQGQEILAGTVRVGSDANALNQSNLTWKWPSCHELKYKWDKFESWPAGKYGNFLWMLLLFTTAEVNSS